MSELIVMILFGIWMSVVFIAWGLLYLKLIRKFEFFMKLTDSASDMEPGIEGDIIDREIQKIKSLLQPLIVTMQQR